ncbi:hypothetical protein AB4090_13095 [Acidithiobacillus sp. IBUN Pt1247-S3]
MRTLLVFGLLLWSANIALAAPAPQGAVTALLKSAPSGDPWPKAEQLCRYNVSKWLNHQKEAMHTWDQNYVSPENVGAANAYFDRIVTETLRAGNPMDSVWPIPKGVEWQDGVHDFPILDPAALEGRYFLDHQIFAPLGLEHWRVLQMSGVFADQKPEYNYDKLQGFYRMLDIVTTLPMPTLRKSITAMIEANGYRMDSRAPGQDPDLDSFVFHFPCNHIGVIVSYTNGATDPDAPKDIHKVIFDKMALQIIDGETTRDGKFQKVTPKMLNYVSIIQMAPIPLGEDTEKYTRRYLLGKVQLDAKKSTKQIALEEKAESEATGKEVIRNAPWFRRLMDEEILPNTEKVAQMLGHTEEYQKLRNWWDRMTGGK